MHSQACFCAHTHYETFAPTYLMLYHHIFYYWYVLPLKDTLWQWPRGRAVAKFHFVHKISGGKASESLLLLPLPKLIPGEMVSLLVVVVVMVVVLVMVAVVALAPPITCPNSLLQLQFSYCNRIILR